jgi:hypothetical protein
MGIVGAWPASRTPVTGAPYSAVQVTEVQRALANGNQIQRRQEAKIYRDSQGRERREYLPSSSATGRSTTFIAIFDPVGGYAYMLNPDKMTAAKTALRTPQPRGMGAGTGMGARARRARAGAQSQQQDLGAQVINGVPATGTRMTQTIPAGAVGNQQPIEIVREVWTSTALKVPVLIKGSDPRFGTTTVQLTNILSGEPDAALFQVPANYTVTTRGPGMMGPMRRRQARD